MIPFFLLPLLCLSVRFDRPVSVIQEKPDVANNSTNSSNLLSSLVSENFDFEGWTTQSYESLRHSGLESIAENLQSNIINNKQPLVDLDFNNATINITSTSLPFGAQLGYQFTTGSNSLHVAYLGTADFDFPSLPFLNNDVMVR